MNDETKLSELPKDIYNGLDQHILNCLDPILYPDISDDPTIFDYFEAYEVETGDIKETSYLWEYLNPRIPMDLESSRILNDLTSSYYFTVSSRSAWICLIKNDDILADYEKELLTHHLCEYPIYNSKLDSWVLTQHI